MKKIIFGENKNIIGAKVKELRIKNGLTQLQLAAKLQTLNINIDQQMISKIENNDRIITDYELACLCIVFNISVDEMLSDSISKIKEMQ